MQSVLIYGSETWPMKVDEMQRLERTETNGEIDVQCKLEGRNTEQEVE